MPKSSLLLAGSIVTAIAAVGCVFELIYGQPRVGVPATIGILALSAPLTVGLFWQAVRFGRQEQEG